MTMTTPDQFLLGGGGKSAKFDTFGDIVTGTITEPPEMRQQTKMGSGEPLTWDDGSPKMQLVVTLQTQLREDADDDGIRKVYVKGSKDPASKSLHAAVAAAVVAAGAKGLQVGGTLTVTYTGNGVSKTPGFNPPKQYAAVYAQPTGAEFLGTAPAAAPAVPAAPAPAPVPAAPAVDPQVVAAYRNLPAEQQDALTKGQPALRLALGLPAA